MLYTLKCSAYFFLILKEQCNNIFYPFFKIKTLADLLQTSKPICVTFFSVREESWQAHFVLASFGEFHPTPGNRSKDKKFCSPKDRSKKICRMDCVIYSRVEWFLKKNLGTCHVVVDCSGTSNPKFYFDLLLFHPAHGKTMPQKTPKIPKKGLKSAHTKLYLTFLKVSPETKCVPYFF